MEKLAAGTRCECPRLGPEVECHLQGTFGHSKCYQVSVRLVQIDWTPPSGFIPDTNRVPMCQVCAAHYESRVAK